MTALIYIYKEDMVCVAMDSLVVDVDKQPVKYMSKVFILPHLQCLICGTGMRNLIMKWFEFVQNSVVFQNVVSLDKHVQGLLKKLSDEVNNPTDNSTTIYHFGVNELSNEMIGYAYRSKDFFKSEELIRGIGIKPVYKNIMDEAIDLINQKGIIPGIVTTMTRLKERDEELDLEQRLGIGGEIHLVILDNKRKYSVQTIHQFSDYDQKLSEMMENINFIPC